MTFRRITGLLAVLCLAVGCDGEDACPTVTVYADADGDGVGAGAAETFCVPDRPAGYVDRDGDCAPDDPGRVAFMVRLGG